MTLRIATVLLLTATFALAKEPATKPVRPDNQPTSKPTAQATTGEKLPSPRELAAKLVAKRDQKNDLLKVAFLDFDQPVAEKPPTFALLTDNALTLQSIIARLHQARDDKNVRAVLINMGETGFNLAQAQEIREALSDISKNGKRTFVFSDAYDTAAYIAATGASDICMLSGGEIMLPGVGMETMFAKGLLDKVGVKADYVQIGQYKGADEQYTRTEPSKEMKGELNKIVDALYEQIVEGISYRRHVSKNDVVDMINGVFMNGTIAKDRKLVDHLVDQDGLRDLLKKELGREVDLLADYGQTPREQIDFSNPFGLFMSLMKKPAEASKHKSAIAVIYAQGVIVDGETGDNLFGGEGNIGSEDLRKALRLAVRDENVEAIVLRIDSPGGSAMASEVMWQAARRAAKEKPLVISVGSMAASGGYYLASAGDYIVADPSAIVGSIGVVGGKFVMKDLFDWAGVHTETFSRGTNADLFSSNAPFTESQRRLVTNWMQRTYEQFTERVLTTRKGKIKDIDEVAHGRIFLAKQALSLGMVDELGGLDAAVTYAAKQANLEKGSFDLKTIPGTRTLGDLLRGGGPEARMPFKPKLAMGGIDLLERTSPAAARLLKQQMQMLQLLQQRPVMLVSPYVISIK